jgi:hypothetical protein
MRCSCCDKELTDAEATAKFVEKDGTKPTRYVEMCAKCRSFLPPDVRYVVRRDLIGSGREPDTSVTDPFGLGDFDDEGW